MDFRAIQIISMAIRTIIDEIPWSPYGSQQLHTPFIQTDDEYQKLELMLDMLGTLTRMMDTRINFLTTEGKVIREWIFTILELGLRYQKELQILRDLEKCNQT